MHTGYRSSDAPAGSDLVTERLRACLAELQSLQRTIDEESFFVCKKRWSDLTSDEVVRHDLFHLVKLVAKIGDYLDLQEHSVTRDPARLVEEVIPDLLVYSLQLSNALDVDLAERYSSRLNDILNKWR